MNDLPPWLTEQARRDLLDAAASGELQHLLASSNELPPWLTQQARQDLSGAASSGKLQAVLASMCEVPSWLTQQARQDLLGATCAGELQQVLASISAPQPLHEGKWNQVPSVGTWLETHFSDTTGEFSRQHLAFCKESHLDETPKESTSSTSLCKQVAEATPTPLPPQDKKPGFVPDEKSNEEIAKASRGDLFSRIDVNNDNSISQQELSMAIDTGLVQALGVEASSTDCFNRVDIDAGGLCQLQFDDDDCYSQFNVDELSNLSDLSARKAVEDSGPDVHAVADSLQSQPQDGGNQRGCWRPHPMTLSPAFSSAAGTWMASSERLAVTGAPAQEEKSASAGPPQQSPVAEKRTTQHVTNASGACENARELPCSPVRSTETRVTPPSMLSQAQFEYLNQQLTEQVRIQTELAVAQATADFQSRLTRYDERHARMTEELRVILTAVESLVQNSQPSGPVIND
jgi:hypothetical protein